MDLSEMREYGEKIWKEAMSIKFNAQKIAWYMRGGVNFVDIMNMSGDEIDNLNKIIEENLETTKQTKLPFF
jgi:hypothetical protein